MEIQTDIKIMTSLWYLEWKYMVNQPSKRYHQALQNSLTTPIVETTPVADESDFLSHDE